MVTHETDQYHRLNLGDGQCQGAPGKPELPVINKKFAIPECQGINILVSVEDSIILENYDIFPAPNIVIDSSTSPISAKEVFCIDTSIYHSNCFFANSPASVSETGYFRHQKLLEINFSPFSFNPITRQLKIFTKLSFILTPVDPTSDLIQETGIFNGLLSKSLLNYPANGMSATTQPTNAESGSVQWINLTDTAMASTIVADYLIIAAHDFFSASSPALSAIANHRASYNGFDVAIVDVNQILALEFTYRIPCLKQTQSVP